MLKFTFANEALEKALREDELLRHLAPNHWMTMAALSPLREAEPPLPPPAPARAGHHWSRSTSKDW